MCQTTVVTNELLVGDVVLLDSGDRMLVDGILIDSMGLVLDEAALTGERQHRATCLESAALCLSGMCRARKPGEAQHGAAQYCVACLVGDRAVMSPYTCVWLGLQDAVMTLSHHPTLSQCSPGVSSSAPSLERKPLWESCSHELLPRAESKRCLG